MASYMGETHRFYRRLDELGIDYIPSDDDRINRIVNSLNLPRMSASEVGALVDLIDIVIEATMAKIEDTIADASMRRAVVCPDCGPVTIGGDVLDHGKPISGVCPKCGDRLYFEPPRVDC